MGTRNLTMVISNGKTKVAQYGQWDGYPSGQGETILTFFKKTNLKVFKEKIDTLATWVTEKQLTKFWKDAGHDGKSEWVSMDISDKFKQSHPQLNRDMAANVLEFIYNSDKPVLLKDDSDFMEDGTWCEWAYVIDLDKNTLSVKVGADKTYSLSKLPTVKKMAKDCKEND
jgi:hypothetical protein